MVCRLCKKKELPDELGQDDVWVPLASQKRGAHDTTIDYTDPANSAFAHLTCCILHGYYCVAHDLAHVRILGSNVYACMVCIEQRARKLGRIGRVYFQILRTHLPPSVFAELAEYIEMVAPVTNSTDEVTLMRAVLLASQKLGKDPDETVEYIVSTRNVHPLIPHPLGLDV